MDEKEQTNLSENIIYARIWPNPLHDGVALSYNSCMAWGALLIGYGILILKKKTFIGPKDSPAN